MKESDLTLTGFAYELRFTNVERKDTTQSIGNNHTREDELAYAWEGSVEIYSNRRERGLKYPFVTERFWPQHVEKLTLADILFLNVCNHLWGIGFRSEEAKNLVIDYMASKLLSSLPFGSDIWQKDPTLSIKVFDFRRTDKDRGLLLSQLISHERLAVEPGTPGSIWRPKPLHT